jgi:hypothetical protein
MQMENNIIGCFFYLSLSLPRQEIVFGIFMVGTNKQTNNLTQNSIKQGKKDRLNCVLDVLVKKMELEREKSFAFTFVSNLNCVH